MKTTWIIGALLANNSFEEVKATQLTKYRLHGPQNFSQLSMSKKHVYDFPDSGSESSGSDSDVGLNENNLSGESNSENENEQPNASVQQVAQQESEGEQDDEDQKIEEEEKEDPDSPNAGKKKKFKHSYGFGQQEAVSEVDELRIDHSPKGKQHQKNRNYRPDGKTENRLTGTQSQYEMGNTRRQERIKMEASAPKK